MASISRKDIPAANILPFSAITGRDDTSQIWCINTSVDMPDGLASDVIITVRQGDGSATTVTLEQAAIAVDITSRAPRDALVKSSHFIAAVQKGMVTLVTEDYALRVNDGARAQSEYTRLYQRQQAIANSARDFRPVAEGSDRQNPTIEVIRRTGAVDANTPSYKPTSSIDLSGISLPGEDEVSGEFIAWFQATNAMALAEAIQAFTARGNVQPHEATYIIKHTNHQRIRDFLSSRV